MTVECNEGYSTGFEGEVDICYIDGNSFYFLKEGNIKLDGKVKCIATSDEPCFNHGIYLSQGRVCKCPQGFFGNRCQLSNNTLKVLYF